MCVCWGCRYISWCICRHQRTACRSRVSSSSIWVLPTELRSLGLKTSVLIHLRLLSSPSFHLPFLLPLPLLLPLLFLLLFSSSLINFSVSIQRNEFHYGIWYIYVTVCLPISPVLNTLPPLPVSVLLLCVPLLFPNCLHSFCFPSTSVPWLIFLGFMYQLCCPDVISSVIGDKFI